MTKDEALDLMLNALELIGHIDGEVRSNFYAKKTIDLVKKKLNTQGEEHMNTGGPAFPNTDATISKEGDYWNYQGMTLRDYFAAKAMEASIGDATRPPAYTYADKAKYAYEMADAMLKAREA